MKKKLKKKYIFTVIEVDTEKLFTFNGGHKAAEFIGIASNTFYNNVGLSFTEKIYNGYRFAKSVNNPIPYKDRGTKINKNLGKQKGIRYI